jgi:hypothetical protein
MKSEWLHAIGCACAAVLFASGARAQDVPVAARNAVGRYQAVTGGETVYVIDTDTGAMLMRQNGKWNIASEGFSATEKSAREREDAKQKENEAEKNWLKTTRETFPKLPLEEKVKAATNILIAMYRIDKGPGGSVSQRCVVTEYLKEARRNRMGPDLPSVGGYLHLGYPEFDSGAKERDTVVFFEVRRERARLYFWIPATPLKSDHEQGIMMLEPSPTIVEDIKAVLRKKEGDAEVH